MRGRGKVTPAVRARILALRAEKLSQREIAAKLAEEGVSLSQPAVLDVLKKHDGAAGRGKGSGRGRGPRTGRTGAGTGTGEGKGAGANAEGAAERPDKAQTPAPTRRDLLAEVHRVLARPQPSLPDDASEELRSANELVMIQRVAIYAELEKGDWLLSQISSALDQLEKRQRERNRLMPAAPPDPKKDPRTLAARAAVHDYVQRSIEGIEARIGARWRASVSGEPVASGDDRKGAR